jgi:hypothetical protein
VYKTIKFRKSLAWNSFVPAKITWRNAKTSWQKKNVVVNKCNCLSFGWIRAVHLSALKNRKAFVTEMRVESQT